MLYQLLAIREEYAVVMVFVMTGLKEVEHVLAAMVTQESLANCVNEEGNYLRIVSTRTGRVQGG